MQSKKVFRNSWIEIDSKAIKNNFLYLKSLQKNSKFFCPVLKSNAYGHGATEIAQILSEFDFSYLGVGLLEEAMVLRENGVRLPILQMGPFDVKDISEIQSQRVTPVVSRWDQLEAVTHVQIPFHLKFETGMNRFGFKDLEIKKLKVFFDSSKFLPESIMTHFHSGHDQLACKNQVRKLEQILNQWPEASDIPVHALNSSALLSWGGSSDYGSRVGLSLYGYSPLGDDKKLKPALSLKSKIVQVHEVNPGETVSYGASFRIEKTTKIGIVPIGYADGYSRSYRDKAFVYCQGKKCPVLGNITMDFLIIDLSEFKNSSELLFSEVTLIGDGITAWDLAQWGQTIPWEVLANLSLRLKRVVL